MLRKLKFMDNNFYWTRNVRNSHFSLPRRKFINVYYILFLKNFIARSLRKIKTIPCSVSFCNDLKYIRFFQHLSKGDLNATFHCISDLGM